MKKKLISILLALLMITSLIPAAAFAADEETTENIEDSGIMPLDDTNSGNTVTFNVTNQSGAALTYTDIMISRAPSQVIGETIAYVTTNDEGVATYQLEDGEYYAYVSYTSGYRKYYDEEFFTVSGSAKTVTLSATNSSSTSSAENRYNRVSYFDHVDIRVRGTATSGTNIDFSSYGITLRNVHVVVNNPSVNGYRDYNFSFTNSTNYEWRKTGLKVHKEAVITVTCDIYVNNQLAQSAFSISFFGKQDFIKAIEQCDGGQGLDFIVNPVDIIQAVMVDVSYQWTMADGSEVPASFPNPPAGQQDMEPGSEHTINTHYTKDYYIVDTVNGKMYYFSGWTHWSDEDTEKTAVPEGAASLEINSDTIIYGVWTVQDLDKADSDITITKTFTDGEGKLLDKSLHPEAYHVYVNDSRNVNIEIPLSMFTYDESTGVYSYTLPVFEDGTYVIEEHEYDVTGYTSASQSYTVTEVSAEHDHIGAVSGTGDSVTTTLTLDYDLTGACEHLGTIAFTNAYTKTVGEDVHNYPALRLNKMDADTRAVLADATFELYKVGENNTLGELVSSQITDESGYAYFWNIEPGEYWLIETEAPDGYMAGYAQYKVIVTEKNGSPVEQLLDGKYCMVHSYDMSVLVNIGDGRGWYPSDHFSEGSTTTRFRLGAFNEKISGQLTITKDIAGDFDETTYPTDIVIHVSGPDNYEKVVTLNADNNWSETLTGLTLGDYTVTERDASVPGYEVNATIGTETVITATITLDKDDVPANYVKNDPVAAETVTIVNAYSKNIGENVLVLPDLNLQKYRTGTTTAVEGAEFTLTQIADENGNTPENPVVITRKTSSYGKITFATLKPGTYELVETAAPETYAADTTKYIVTVKEVSRAKDQIDKDNNAYYDVITYDVTVTGADFADATNTVTLYNQKAYGNLTINKDFGVNSALDMSNMDGEIRLLVTGPDGYSKEVVMNAENNGVVFIDELPFGEYTIDEIDSTAERDGYEWTVVGDEQTISVTAENETHYVTISNTYAEVKVVPASFTVKKVDAADKSIVLSGVVFGLYDGDEKIAEATTDTNGNAVFSGFVEEGNYTLKEEATLDDYILSDEVWTVTVRLNDGDPVVKIKDGHHFLESIYNWIIGMNPTSDWNDGVLTVRNEKKTAELELSKAVVYTLNGAEVTFDALPSEFRDMVKSEFTFEVTIDGETETVELQDGESWKKELPYGAEYSITELQAEDDIFNMYRPDNYEGVIGDDTSEVAYVNGYNFWNYKESREDEGFDYDWAILEVYKFDSGRPKTLSGAEFVLYSDEACTEAVATAVSDENGVLTFEIKAAGTYYLKEKVAPEGYKLSDTVYTVNASAWYETLVNAEDGFVQIIEHITVDAEIDKLEGEYYAVLNDPYEKFDITVKKVWVSRGGAAHPESVDVVLYRDGEAFETVTLSKDNNWTYTWTVTEEHEWEVDEASVPSGYNKTVDVKDNVYTITNTHKDIPNTGDNGNLALFAAVMVIAAAGFVLILTKKNKKAKEI